MAIATLYLMATEGNGREFTLSPVDQATGVWLGGGRDYQLPDGYELIADRDCERRILDKHGRVCKIFTVLTGNGALYPVLISHVGMIPLQLCSAAGERR